MVALWNRAGHYNFALWFYLCLSSFFSSPNLSRRRLDVCHTSTHDVVLVWIFDAGLKRAARGLLKRHDAKSHQKIAIWAPLHNFVGLYLCMYRQSEKKLLNSNIFSTCPHNMVNFGPLGAEIILLVWGTPANFNRFCVLAALQHGTLVVGVNQTVALNRRRHLYSAGQPSRWALVHIVVFLYSACANLSLTWLRQLVPVSNFLVAHQHITSRETNVIQWKNAPLHQDSQFNWTCHGHEILN